MSSNVFLLIFAVSFMGCVLATPVVTKIAAWAGAIDRPDQYRRIHTGAIPRMGGLALAFGLGLSLLPIMASDQLPDWVAGGSWARLGAITIASVIILMVGVYDDAREMRPKPKLIGQAVAVLVLYAGGVRIENVGLLGLELPLSAPLSVPLPGLSSPVTIDLPSLLITMLWFLACMNIWNLIDGMDGLASGVGLLVTGTLMLVAISLGNMTSAALAAALAGSLSGFLLYNWHPACIFLGDSGSLLIGMLIGVIGVQGSLKGTTTVSILFPILAMGLPVSDTAMAIFRRWVRNLPLSSADRRHVHHLLIGLGLNPRQAALVLYFFTASLCGVVLLGVAYQSDGLALILGISGCLAFLLILLSRRDELSSLVTELGARWDRKRQEREASRITWETIQKIELCDSLERTWSTLQGAAKSLGSDQLVLSCRYAGRSVLVPTIEHNPGDLSGPTASFRLSGGQDLELSVSLHHGEDSPLAADIAFRSLQRISLATAQRLERMLSREVENSMADAASDIPEGCIELASTKPPGEFEHKAGVGMLSVGRDSIGWLRGAFGFGPSMTPRQTWSGDK